MADVGVVAYTGAMTFHIPSRNHQRHECYPDSGDALTILVITNGDMEGDHARVGHHDYGTPNSTGFYLTASTTSTKAAG